MAQGLLQWSPCPHFFPLRSLNLPFHTLTFPPTKHAQFSISATLSSPTTDNTTHQQLTARERRKLRNERREIKNTGNWREEVEERLCKKPKKQYASWTEKLNLDLLANLGPQWWVIRVARVRDEETVERLARSLVRNYPDLDFKIYYPSIQVKRILKKGTYSVKPKPLFPGSVFLLCIMNKEIHDFIREFDGVGGFVGSKVGNTKRQINKPKPVSVVDMEAIFRQAKEAQEKIDRDFEEEERERSLKFEILKSDSHLGSNDATESVTDSRPKGRSRKADKLLAPGSTVRVISGIFAGFEGSLRKLNRRTKKATVGFTLFGKENIVDLHVNDIVAGK